MVVPTESRGPLTEAVLARLPVFPLPRAVLFPGVVIPLHLFEPRYRALGADCVRGHGYMALAALKRGFEDDYEGRPPVHEVMGVGTIVAHQQLDNGRWNIALRGVARARLVEELAPNAPYRVGKVQLLEDITSDGDVEVASRLRELILQIMVHVPVVRPQLIELLRQATTPGLVADAAAAVFEERFPARQALLECLEVSRRVDTVHDHLTGVLLDHALDRDMAVN